MVWRTWDVPCTVLEDRSPEHLAWSVGDPDRPMLATLRAAGPLLAS